MTTAQPEDPRASEDPSSASVGAAATSEETSVGSYFISNYPPYSFWNEASIEHAERAIDTTPPEDRPLGLYLHIPFCRKRCKFCYFRVYTDKNSRDIETYMSAIADEAALYSTQPVLSNRPVRFVYFGGGTPSYLGTHQLLGLVDRLRESVGWDNAEEVTFECEPGTLNPAKVDAMKEIGVTRVSLGVENFNDAILEENGRAHLSAEIERSYEWIQAAEFQYVNIDLIAGMVGETAANWTACIDKAIALAPDSVTIYQMELPYNTVYSKDILADGKPTPVADWNTKRAWVTQAFDAFRDAGYSVSSAYTVVKDGATCNFSYRDHLWRGADLVGTGVASFSHVNGVHYQNLDRFDDYVDTIRQGRLPLSRALPINDTERLIRELILQLKLGRIDAGYFRDKFGREILVDFCAAFEAHRDRGFLDWSGDTVTLTQAGLVRVDSLLPDFFLQEHRGARYT